MGHRQSRAFSNWLHLLLVLIVGLSLCPGSWAQGADSVEQDGVRYIKYTGNDGTVWLEDDRRPSLYTQQFGDCQGDSLINVTRFDAAYYKDNMTVQFHLGGNTALANEDIMRESYSYQSLTCSSSNLSSLHWSFCLWRKSLQPDFQSLPCQHTQSMSHEQLGHNRGQRHHPSRPI